MKSGGSIGLDRATSSAHRVLRGLERVDEVAVWIWADWCTYGCADCCTMLDEGNVVVDVVDILGRVWSTVRSHARYLVLY